MIVVINSHSSERNAVYHCFPVHRIHTLSRTGYETTSVIHLEAYSVASNLICQVLRDTADLIGSAVCHKSE